MVPWSSDRDDGIPVLVLVGGVHLDHSYMRVVGELLAGTRSKYVDLSGTGSGAAPVDRTLEHGTWMTDIEHARRDVPAERLVLFGHSYGGFLCQDYLVRHPGRVAGAVLCCTAPVFDYAEEVLGNARARGPSAAADALQHGLSRPAVSDDHLQETWRAVLPLYFAEPPDPADLRSVTDARCSAAAFNAAYFGCLQAFDVREELPGVDVPLLVLSGDDDFICPTERGADRIAARAPNTAAYEFHSGHFPWIERPHEFARVVGDWIAETIGGADGRSRP